MTCLIKGCTIEVNYERMLGCWLCHGLCHFKCSGLPVLAAEAVTRHKGLHWCCPDCRHVGASFYRFFQGTQTNFLEIQKEASELSDRISAYGKMFEDFKSLDNLKSPTQSSPKRRKSARKKDKRDDSADISDTPVSSKLPTTNDDFTTNLKKTPKNNQPLNPMDTLLNKSQTTEPLNYAKALKSPGPASSNTQSIRHPLRAIPPNKNVFVSRLASETTIDDVEYYIKSKLASNAVISVYKFVYSQPRSITSFKITVPDEIFNIIMHPDFWPVSTFVREYKEKQRTAVHLPSREFNIPKN